MGDCAALPAATVEGFPKLSSLTCVLSNLNLNTSLGPEPVGVNDVAGEQVGVGVGVGAGVGSSSSFLQELNTSAQLSSSTALFKKLGFMFGVFSETKIQNNYCMPSIVSPCFDSRKKSKIR
jgi:hypothetical protein